MIDIVGSALRLPGANNGEELWSLLRDGRCVISQIPKERWSYNRFWHPRQTESGKSYTFAAGVLEDLWGFDPAVFAISPREAEQMDPQQRLLLQVVFEAIENAGVSPETLSGEKVGVFVGSSSLDYSNVSFIDPAVGTGHFMTGNTLSIASNRISYIFNFTGPSFTVDTACSSSLVALNEAVRALETGEIETAIVAGANILASPYPFIGFSQATMLSPEGLCRAFDERGFGYVRAEGVLAIVLRRSDVSAWKGQRTLAQIVGSDVNADGRTMGMSLPSQDHQAELLRRIYDKHGIDPKDLAFVEAHGTGTRVGDPAEAGSIGTVLGQSRTDVLPIGSIKTNIGHLEPASGLAGVMKAILALEHDYLPASLHFENPNPDIDFAGLNIEVAAHGKELKQNGAPRYAGVNSFGFGGTNAHVILKDAPKATQSVEAAKAGKLMMLSAQSEDALRDLAGAYAKKLEGVAESEAALISNASYHRRQAFAEKLVIERTDNEASVSALQAFARETSASGVHQATASGEPLPCAFVYSGNGAQWAGMGQAAYQHNDVFKAVFERVSHLFEGHANWSLVEALFADDLESRLEQTSVAQPLLFAVQVGLTEALKQSGIQPSLTFGHSIGEVAASWASGMLSLEEATALVFHRSNLQERVAGAGTMAALMLGRKEAEDAIKASGLSSLEVAANNSPRSTTISGVQTDLEAFQKFARQNRWACRAIKLNYPFHSALVDPVEAPFRQAMEGHGLAAHAQAAEGVPMISTVTGKQVSAGELTVDYWWRNLREQVAFAEATQAAITHGISAFIEIGPKPVLTGYLRQCMTEAEQKGVVLASLSDKQEQNADPITAILAQVVAQGFAVDEAKVFGENPDAAVNLPTYPWQNKEYHFNFTQEAATGDYYGGEHPLLGWRKNADGYIWTSHVDTQLFPYLDDHRVGDQIILPGAAYVDMALSAARVFYEVDDVELVTMDLVAALQLSDNYLMELRTEISGETGLVEIKSRKRLSGDEWTINARGRVFKQIDASSRPVPTEGQGNVLMRHQAVYERATEHGLNYGPAFALVEDVSSPQEDVLRVKIAGEKAQACVEGGTFGLHPAALDSAFHGLFALFQGLSAHSLRRPAYIPIHFARVKHYGPARPLAFAEITLHRSSANSILADFTLFDADNAALMELKGCRFRATELGRQETSEDLIYRVDSKLVSSTAAFKGDGRPRVTALQDLLQNTATTDKEELRESQLLLEAAVRRSAYDILSAASERFGSVHPDHFPQDHRSYFVRLADILVEAGLASVNENGGYSLASVVELPEADALLYTILSETPEDISAVTLLALARKNAFAALEGADLSEASGAMLDQFWVASPEAVTRQNVVKSWLSPVLEAWDKDRPLHLLDLAGSGLELARFVLANRPVGTTTVTIATADSRSAARLAAISGYDSALDIIDLSKDTSALADKGAFDLILSSGSLHTVASASGGLLSECVRLLAPHGQLVTVEPVLDDYHDMVFGLMPGWFAGSLGDGFPVGPLKSALEWQTELASLGLQAVVSHQTVVDGVGCSLLQAEAPLATDEDALTSVSSAIEHALILFGENAAETTCAEALATSLEASGSTVTLVNADSNEFEVERVEDWHQLFETSGFASASARAIIHLYGAGRTSSDDFAQLSTRTYSSVTLAKALDGAAAQLIYAMPTGSCHSEHYETGSAVQSGLWGFARVLTNEAPDLKVISVDVALDDNAEKAALALLNAMDPVSDTREWASLTKCVKTPVAVKGLPESNWQTADAVQLTFDKSGSLDSLYWSAVDRRAPAKDEVEVEVVATGLNFRDVMWSLGMLPEEALEDGYGGPTLGLEVSGRVLRVGAGVTHVEPGDDVIAFTASGFSSHVCVPGYATAKIPEGQDLVAAATVPVTFLTAFYALRHLGDLREDQWVLIHGGAGGVGLAALQIAQWAGAKVISTAGSEEKRELLHVLGADYVLDSRSLDFAEQVMEITAGEGVHCVLNSLAGEAMERSLQLVRPFGRFLELGKRDFYADTKIGLRPFRRNISYFGIDLDQLLSYDMKLANQLITEVFALLADGTFSALPYRVFAGENVQDAYRLMQRSGHIGKIVVTPPDLQRVKVPAKIEPQSFSADGAHIVVGGLGGFGGEVAKWLADGGAKHIVLTSRRGLVSDAHQKLIDKLAERGVTVEARTCDVTDRNAVDALLSSVRKTRSIRGLGHSAMVLDDGMLTGLSRERFESVLAPKVKGGRLLDELTRQDELDYFILFSSITTLVGNPGQAHYVAANAYLEGLARERRAQGLPAIAVGWGAIKDVGFLAQNTEVSEKVACQLGESMIRAREGLDLLSGVMQQDDGAPENSVVHIGRFDWQTALKALPLLQTPLFEQIAAHYEGNRDTGSAINILEMIQGRSEKEALHLIAEQLVNEISGILRLPAEEIHPSKPLAGFGMDSLMGLELRMGIQSRFGIEIPLISLSGDTCINDFAEVVLRRLRDSESGTAETGEDLDMLAGQHVSQALSEDDKASLRKVVTATASA